VQQAEQVFPLVERVIAQIRKRVLENKKVPSSEKVLRLFEPHTRAIPRHKGGALVEFGRLVTLDEVEGGLVTRYHILSETRVPRCEMKNPSIQQKKRLPIVL
jgi:transposase, IS5 family